jgi:hypothetical protein
MAVRASVEDERFYKKIEKSLDTTASFWTFASEGLKTYELARAQALLHEYNESPVKPGTLSKVLAKADKAKKYYEYVRRVETLTRRSETARFLSSASRSPWTSPRNGSAPR